jgi:hypothetical protein
MDQVEEVSHGKVSSNLQEQLCGRQNR